MGMAIGENGYNRAPIPSPFSRLFAGNHQPAYITPVLRKCVASINP